MEKKESKSYWLKAGSFTLLERLSVALFGFLAFYLLVRKLDQQSYGVWVLFTSISTILELVRNGLIRSPMIRYIASSDPDEHGRIQTASLVINVICTLLFVLVLILAAYPLSVTWEAPQIIMLSYVYGITSVFLVFFTHFECVQHAYFSFKGSFVGYSVQKGFFFSA